MTVECSYGHGRARLVDATVVYGPSGLKYPPRYLCDTCQAHVGTHAGTRPPEPLGTLANAEVRELRKRCHAAFDIHWVEPRNGRRKRRARAYTLLAQVMGIHPDDCHIGSWQEEEYRKIWMICIPGGI